LPKKQNKPQETRVSKITLVTTLLDKFYHIAREGPEVQLAMNFTVGWIRVYKDRTCCIPIGEKTGLYKMKWYQKAVHLITCLIVLQLGIINEANN